MYLDYLMHSSWLCLVPLSDYALLQLVVPCGLAVVGYQDVGAERVTVVEGDDCRALPPRAEWITAHYRLFLRISRLYCQSVLKYYT